MLAKIHCDYPTCYIFISSSLCLTLLSEEDFESLGWDDLVALKRKHANELKELTDKIVDIDKVRLRSISENIKVQKSHVESYTTRMKEIRFEIDKHNATLFSVSEKLSQ